jgi:putative FmdB family regulatory protein
MPLYGFRCPACGSEFEDFIHSIAKVDETVTNCPVCLTPAVRLLSAPKHTFDPGSFFEPYVDTDITGSPIQINSRQQFFNECEKAGKGYRKIRDKLR